MSLDPTTPGIWWPGPDGFQTSVDNAALVDAVYAVAAELRTANLMTLIQLQETGLNATLDQVMARLGVEE